jgi:hypothetical protein
VSRRKPQRGCCGVCGCAVVAPSEVESAIAIGEVQTGGTWDRPIIETGWARGHQYDDAGRLVQVRCRQHGGLGWAVEPVVATDATVLM